jgi:hypothetical protein
MTTSPVDPNAIAALGSADLASWLMASIRNKELELLEGGADVSVPVKLQSVYRDADPKLRQRLLRATADALSMVAPELGEAETLAELGRVVAYTRNLFAVPVLLTHLRGSAGRLLAQTSESQSFRCHETLAAVLAGLAPAPSATEAVRRLVRERSTDGRLLPLLVMGLIRSRPSGWVDLVDMVADRRWGEESVIDLPAFVMNVVDQVGLRHIGNGLVLAFRRGVLERYAGLLLAGDQPPLRVSADQRGCRLYDPATGESHKFPPRMPRAHEFTRRLLKLAIARLENTQNAVAQLRRQTEPEEVLV